MFYMKKMWGRKYAGDVNFIKGVYRFGIVDF